METLLTDFVIPFLWGLVVLSGFIGWGSAAARLSGAPEPDWGLSAGWGMALVIAFGGVLSLAGAALPPVLMAVVVVGAVLHLGGVLKGRASGRPSAWAGFSKRTWLVMGFVAVAVASRYTSIVWFQAANCSDDDIAYFNFVSRLLQTGSLIDPYSLRRLSGYGGHTVLQALVMALGSEDNGHLLDRGVALIVCFGLVAGFSPKGGTAGKAGAIPYLLAAALVLIMPFPLANSSSHVTGLAMFLTLFRTLHGLNARDEAVAIGNGAKGARALWLAGLVTAAAAALKAHYMVAAGLTVFFFWLVSGLSGQGRHRDDPPGGLAYWRRHGNRLIHMGVSALIFLAPWMALMGRSSGTPLYPLFQGNHRPGFSETYSGVIDLATRLGHLGDFFLSAHVGLFVVPLVLYAVRRGPAAGLGLYLGGLITAAITTWTLTYDNLETLHRYAAPFLNAAFIATVIYYLGRIREDLPAKGATAATRMGDKILYVLVIALLPIPIYHDVNRLAGALDRTVMPPDRRAAYAEMQAAIPEGEGFLSILDQPFALDYSRNAIATIDVPGAVSPNPGMPFFKGPGALKDYLLGQSLGYIAFRDFEAKSGCLYRRDLWEYHAGDENAMWRRQSKYYLDLMDAVTALANTEKTIYRAGGLSVIGLSR